MAKVVGDRFSVGLNNRQIALREMPFLGWESPERMDRLLASDVMSAENLCYVYPITRIESLERLLKTTAYSAFLVVTPVEPEHVPERPKKVHDILTPLLYRRPSIRKFTEWSGKLCYTWSVRVLDYYGPWYVNVFTNIDVLLCLPL